MFNNGYEPWCKSAHTWLDKKSLGSNEDSNLLATKQETACRWYKHAKSIKCRLFGFHFTCIRMIQKTCQFLTEVAINNLYSGTMYYIKIEKLNTTNKKCNICNIYMVNIVYQNKWGCFDFCVSQNMYSRNTFKYINS